MKPRTEKRMTPIVATQYFFSYVKYAEKSMHFYQGKKCTLHVAVILLCGTLILAHTPFFVKIIFQIYIFSPAKPHFAALFQKIRKISPNPLAFSS